jgi:hypothetical protein
MDSGILVPIGFFAMIAAIVIVPNYLRVRERQEMQATVRAAIEKGQPLPPELVEALVQGCPCRGRCPRRTATCGSASSCWPSPAASP